MTGSRWNVLEGDAGKLAGESASTVLDGRYECSMPEPGDQCALSSYDDDYIDDLWFTLHHSEDKGDVVLGLRWYLDDSGSDDGSPLVTCGGVAMDRINFKHFSARWQRMYEGNTFSGLGLKPPLHMSDFASDGKYPGLHPEFKRAVFREVVEIVNAHKLYSMSIAVSQSAFASQLPEDVRKVLIGPYAFAFMSLVLGHQLLSEGHSQGPLKASYLVDYGFVHYEQLEEVHRVIYGIERGIARDFGGLRHTGPLDQERDDRVPALQAADAVAWASRKKELTGTLPEGFEPLLELLREEGANPLHLTIPIDLDGIKMLADPINKWTTKYGKLPTLADVLVRRVGSFAVKLKS